LHPTAKTTKTCLSGSRSTTQTDAVVAAYLDMCDRSRHVVANAASLDAIVPGPVGAPANLRSILVHMVEETSRHNGHADIIRELLDGTTGY
jgi:hypothetical protein